MKFSIRLTEEEEEYDVSAFEEAYKAYQEDGERSRDISEFWQELEL